MYVSRIEMVGFKSFVDKTVVDLEPGLTSIVGPNGCGKTNICDAIRWVLGEENVRLLRGTRAEDVIFAGTELRKPTGYAEVALTVSDVQDVLPVDYADVTVTRRAFRSGDSEFLINNVPVEAQGHRRSVPGHRYGPARLLGDGARHDRLDPRGHVGPAAQDRRGGRRHQQVQGRAARRPRASRSSPQRDLERVQDLISEVERRVRQLARQAAKARRYERLAGRISRLRPTARPRNSRR